MIYTARAMFSRYSKLRHVLALTMPLCLLWLFLSCVTICGHCLEDGCAADTDGAIALQADESCPVMSLPMVVTSGRYFFSSDGHGEASFAAPICLAEIAQPRNAQRLIFRSSLSPPFARLRTLRI